MKKSLKLNLVQTLRVAMCVVILLVCSFGLGQTLAKFINVQRQGASSKADAFHFSSNYLTEQNNTYNVVATDNIIEVEIYNYEINNLALVSMGQINYSIEVSSGWEYEVRDKDGQVINKSSVYSLDKLENGQLNHHKLYLQPNGEQTSLTVSVSSSSPIVKTLSATFNMTSNHVVNYSITNYDEYVVLRIETNGYSGNLTISWDNLKFVPDNTNSVMENWQNSSPSETLVVSAYNTYDLMFFKTTAGDYSGSGTGTNITLGGV